ncbi:MULTISPECIES: hypothetical protein [unclassified Agarivorans]
MAIFSMSIRILVLMVMLGSVFHDQHSPSCFLTQLTIAASQQTTSS